MNERQGFLLGLIFLFGTVAALMLKPFAAYIFGAMILAFILKKPHFRLRRRIGDRPSALLMTISSIVLAVLPLILAGAAVAEDARGLVEDVNRTDVVDFETIEESLQELTGQEVDIQATITSAIQSFSTETLGSFSRFVTIFTQLLIGVSVMLFLTYYFLKDGQGLVEWLKEVSPLPREIEDDLHDRLELTTTAVMKGHIMVAIAQGLIAGLGLAVFGVPNYIFWTFMMVILGVIPIVGSFLVWFPASIYLLISEEPVSAALLFLYGAIVVGATDNFLRPFVVDDEADLHPALIILGVIGGVYLFGVAGLFLGPIAFGIFKSVLTVFMDSYQDL
jgi:predicted PurR-regulated permease PerM